MSSIASRTSEAAGVTGLQSATDGAARGDVPADRSGLPVIALTLGEPAGIGPDIVVMAAQRTFPARLIVIGDGELLASRAARLRLPLPLDTLDRGAGWSLEHLPLAVASRVRTLDPRNARSVLATLEHAVNGCRGGRFDAMVTAPLHKGVINDAGIPFSGHTEFLADRAGARRVVMMLVGGSLRVALATTHLPLREVPAAITRESLSGTLRVLHADLVRRFDITAPRILVAGLNPHAGESGHLGREEVEVIVPVLDALRAEGFLLEGPLPADTLFHRDRLAGADCVLAMYHDQGLPVIKFATFGHGVNITLGLPFLRTSVDHGTALERAGTDQVDPGSLVAAIELAIELALRARATSRPEIGGERRFHPSP
jgi:4-hydroxythreonine-4-phosphate dehydrogenase